MTTIPDDHPALQDRDESQDARSPMRSVKTNTLCLYYRVTNPHRHLVDVMTYANEVAVPQNLAIDNGEYPLHGLGVDLYIIQKV